MNPQFCPKCGNELPPQAIFCPKCGQSVLPVSQEYSIAQNNFKKAYFYWKLRGFLGLLIFSIACECFFGIEGISSKILTIIISSAAGIGIFKLLDDQITRLTNIELFYNPFREDPEDEKKAEEGEKYLENLFKAAHPGAFKAHKFFGVLFWIFAIITFLLLFVYCEAGGWFSVHMALRTLLWYGLLETGIWTFKWAILIVFFVVAALLGATDELIGESSTFSTNTFGSDTFWEDDSEEELSYRDMFQIDSALASYLDDGTPAVELEYTFTNRTGKTVAPFSTFNLHIYQDGVELDEDIFGGSGDGTNKVMDGASVTFTEVYKLNNTTSDILVQITPWIDVDGTVYYEKTFGVAPAFSSAATANENVQNHPSTESSVPDTSTYLDLSYQPSADALQYFIAHCDTEYFTEADIQTFDADMCRIARNSIYARLGRKFDSQDLTLYFEQYDWYIPVIDPEDFSDEMLNQYQVANRDLIVAFETQKGYR